MVDAPKNLLKGTTGNNPQIPPKQNPLLSQKETNKPKNSGAGGGWKIWTVFVLGIIIGLLIAWIFIGNKESKVEVNSGDDNARQEENMMSNEEQGGNSSGSALTESPTGGPMSYQDRKEPVVISGSNEISVQDQTAGMTVAIELAKFSVPGWVAIHEDNPGRENNLGNILGAQRLDPGIHLTEVELLRGTTPGGKYHAVLYVDNGDRQFDSSKDAPIKDADGKLIESTFNTN